MMKLPFHFSCIPSLDYDEAAPRLCALCKRIDHIPPIEEAKYLHVMRARIRYHDALAIGT